jgi:hypothetical protein
MVSLNEMYGACCLQVFVNSTGKFNSVVVETLKMVLCSFRDGVPLIKKVNISNKIVYQCALFEPGFDPW